MKASEIVGGISHDYGVLLPKVLKYLNDLVKRSEDLLPHLAMHYMKTKSQSTADMTKETSDRIDSLREIAQKMVSDPSFPAVSVAGLKASCPMLFAETVIIDFDDAQDGSLVDEKVATPHDPPASSSEPTKPVEAQEIAPVTAASIDPVVLPAPGG